MDLNEFLTSYDSFFPPRPSGTLVPAKSDGPRCGRLTRKKTPCQRPLMCTIATPWEELLGVPAPNSCSDHLTDKEKEIVVRIREAMQRARDRSHERPPACHTWDPPTPGQSMWDWQDGRCAICGDNRGNDLVTDHCHKSGLVRGGLCRACNIQEGLYPGGTYAQYRLRPPVAFVGHTEPYLFHITYERAEPSARTMELLGPRPEGPAEAVAYLVKAGGLPWHDYDTTIWNPLRLLGHDS